MMGPLIIPNCVGFIAPAGGRANSVELTPFLPSGFICLGEKVEEHYFGLLCTNLVMHDACSYLMLEF